MLLDSTTCKAHRAASGAARSDAEAECLGRSRGGLCSKLHARADGAGRILRLIPSPGQHSDLRHAPALMSLRKSPCDFAGIPARDAALDRGYVSAKLRAAAGQDVVGQHGGGKVEECGAGMAEAAQLGSCPTAWCRSSWLWFS